MEKYGVFQKLTPLLIKTKDARSALRLVELGEVDFGIVYYSDAVTSSNVKTILKIPETSHEPIIYSGILLQTDNTSVEDYFNFLVSQPTSLIWERHGFSKK